MATVTHAQSISGGGVTIQPLPIARTNSGAIGLEDTVSAAKVGQLTTRSDDDTGTLTMSTGHGFTDGQVIDIFWTGGVQYGATIGTVSTNSVPFDTGIGDDLPVNNTAITAMVQKSVNLAIDGDNADLIAVILETTDKSLRTAGHVQFRDVSNAEIAEVDLVTNVPQVWDIEGGSANPFTGNPITNMKVSQGGVVEATLKIVGVQDASP